MIIIVVAVTAAAAAAAHIYWCLQVVRHCVNHFST